MSQHEARDTAPVGVDVANGSRAQLFESLVANSPDAIITVGTDGRVRYANYSVRRLLGYAPADLVGEPVSEVVPDEYVDSFREIAERYLETGQRTINWDGAELLAATADGEQLPVSVAIVEHYAGEEWLFTAVLRDISKKLDRRDRQRLAEREDETASVDADLDADS